MNVNIPTPIAVALLGVLGPLIGYFVSNALDRRKAIRLREMEFRLDRYREFLLAFGEVSRQATVETQSRFVNSVNIILLIGGADLLKAIKDLADNYNDPTGTLEKQQPILDRIVFQMRRDLNAPDSHQLANFEFPMIVSDIEPQTKSKQTKSKPSRTNREG
jgi:xanthosine utilization system XapX-like protein